MLRFLPLMLVVFALGCDGGPLLIPVKGTVKFEDGSIPAGEPGDGVYAGDYKVVFEIYKTYIGRESLVQPEFEKIATSPLTAKVEKGAKNEFAFVVKRRLEE
jgi:hypothetical protein